MPHDVTILPSLDDLEPAEVGPRVTEVPFVGTWFPLPRDRVHMHDVLWFSPRPPPIESAEIPVWPEADETGDRPSVAPVAMPSISANPPRPGVAATLNPVLMLGIVGALVAAAYFAQPHRGGAPTAQLALAFPDRFEIDMTEPTPLVDAESLPVFVEEAKPAKPARAVVLPASVPEPPVTGQHLPAFDSTNALAALQSVSGSAGSCVSDHGALVARVSVTFAPSGRVTLATVDGSLAGTPEGSCIARALRSARMAGFEGPHVTVRRTIRLR